MPTYEYVCRDCGQHLEVVQSFNDKPLTTCTNCKGALRKVFRPVGIVLKGSGFYKTDTRTTASSSETKADTAATKTESTTTSGGGSKSDSGTTSEKSA